MTVPTNQTPQSNKKTVLGLLIILIGAIMIFCGGMMVLRSLDTSFKPWSIVTNGHTYRIVLPNGVIFKTDFDSYTEAAEVRDTVKHEIEEEEKWHEAVPPKDYKPYNKFDQGTLPKVEEEASAKLKI